MNTDNGKDVILRFLAGLVGGFGASIEVGVGSDNPASTDTRLTFGLERVNVDVKSVDYTTGEIVFKITLPQTLSGEIHEIGLWNSAVDTNSGEFTSRILTGFDVTNEGWTNASSTTSNIRIYSNGANVSATATNTTSTRISAVLDLSGYSVDDIFLIAFYKPDNYIDSITLSYENSSTNGKYYLTKTISALPTGYNVLAFRKGDFTASGTISWDGIDRFGVDVTAGATGGTLTLDGIRVEDTDSLNPGDVLISHSLLSSPLVKTNVAPMDIEYALGVTVS